MSAHLGAPVLVVGDSRARTEVLCRSLEVSSLPWVGTVGAREAFRAFSAQPIDAAVVHVSLGSASELDALVRRFRQHRELGLVLVSSGRGLDALAHAMRLGAVDCLLDSSDPRELGEAVGRAIAWGARPAATQLLDAVLDQRRDEIVRVLSDAIAGHALDEGVEYLYRDRPVYLRSVRRVVSIARMIASAMAVGDEAGRHVEQAALLHDLGRLVLLDLVLDDGQPCTSGESALTRARFTWTAATLDLIPQLAPAARAIASVRERVDGSGEPNGMRGNEIPIGSRILAVAVAFDSISAAWSGSPDDAIAQANAELVRGSGHLFDPLVVRAWLRALDRFGSILREVN